MVKKKYICSVRTCKTATESAKTFCPVMSLPVISLIFLMSVGAAFVQRVSGFGFGIFIMTMLPFLLPTYGEATALSGLLALVTSLFITLRLRRYIPWRKLLPILFTFLVVSWMAVMAVAGAPEHLLRIVLGIALMAASLYFFLLSHRLHLPASLGVQIGMGTLSGIMGGLFGMQGPPAVLYFISTTSTKEEYMAIAQCYFLIGNLFMTAYRAQAGFLTPAVAEGWLSGLLGVALGTMLGAKVFHRIPLPLLRRIIYLYMGLSGLLVLLS